VTPEKPVHEESLWFGVAHGPLFGRLTTPVDEKTLGGILLSPPIGRESRLARRALRSLAFLLAADGYVSLRFDHFGTGDSSGMLDDKDFSRAWTEGVAEGVDYLRSLGVSSVSAIGMRMGATIAGSAAADQDLGLSSFVMWDPCESGRAYVRELSALGALRREVVSTDSSEPTTMLEYPFEGEVANRISQFTLSDPTSRPLAERVLVVAREDRPVSSKFRLRWEAEHVDWATTSEQGALLETELPLSQQPWSTITRIREWLTALPTESARLSLPPSVRDAVLMTGSDAHPVRERVVELGPRKLFGIVSEPEGGPMGPLIVMVNGINEDHVGPSRLWVELSRQWAGEGLRCVRFDLSELGESPWSPGQPNRPVFDKLRDVGDALRELNPGDPSDSFQIGLCSGAQLALDVALEYKTRGVCAINPQVGRAVLRNADRLKESGRESIRSFARKVENELARHLWVGAMIRQFSRLVTSSAYSPKVRSTLVKNGSEMLLLVGPDDLSPFPWIPIIGSVDRRRFVSSDHLRLEIVPGLDHDFLSSFGRSRAVEILDRYIVETFTDVTGETDIRRPAVEGS
jgi:pimeloyl-ACP methyl ester carboxylesterase